MGHMNQQSGPLDESGLRETLREMAEADANLTTPSRVEETLMKAWETKRQARPPRKRSRGVAWAFLAVAASLIVAIILRERAPGVNPAVPVSHPEESSWGAVGDGSTPYEPIAWLDANPATLQVVRLRVPSAKLAEQGYSVSDIDGNGNVEIEVFMGTAGEARIIRVIPAWPETRQ
jgi:hypothetical protein